MIPEIHWIGAVAGGRLAIMPRPRGADWLEDEIAAFQRMGVTHILSLLTPAEEVELDITNEASAVRRF